MLLSMNLSLPRMHRVKLVTCSLAQYADHVSLQVSFLPPFLSAMKTKLAVMIIDRQFINVSILLSCPSIVPYVREIDGHYVDGSIGYNIISINQTSFGS